MKAGDTVLLNSVRTSTDIDRGKAQASSIETSRADALLVSPPNEGLRGLLWLHHNQGECGFVESPG